jgi:hypothetical protein
MPNTNAMKKSLGYRGAETWNALPIDLKSLGSIATFKSGVKQCRLIIIFHIIFHTVDK